KTSGAYTWTLLTQVVYEDGPPAIYSYQKSNLSDTALGNTCPLPAILFDPKYEGAPKQVYLRFKTPSIDGSSYPWNLGVLDSIHYNDTPIANIQPYYATLPIGNHPLLKYLIDPSTLIITEIRADGQTPVAFGDPYTKWDGPRRKFNYRNGSNPNLNWQLM